MELQRKWWHTFTHVAVVSLFAIHKFSRRILKGTYCCQWLHLLCTSPFTPPLAFDNQFAFQPSASTAAALTDMYHTVTTLTHWYQPPSAFSSIALYPFLGLISWNYDHSFFGSRLAVILTYLLTYLQTLKLMRKYCRWDTQLHFFSQRAINHWNSLWQKLETRWLWNYSNTNRLENEMDFFKE